MTPAATESRDQLRRLSVLIGVAFVDMLGFMLILPLLPFYAERMNATPFVVGAIISAFSVAQLISAPIWGRVSDRYGRRPALLIGLASSGVGFLIFGFANSVAMLFLCRLVQGAGGGTTGVAQAYVSDTVTPADRAKALGWLSAGASAGVMIGPVVGSLVIHLGHAAPGFVAAGLCLINVITAWKWLPESQSQEVRMAAAPRRPVFGALLHALFHPLATPAAKFIWIYGMGMLAFSAFTSMMALWLGARFQVTERTIGYFFAYNGALAVILRSILLGPFIHRYGELKAMRYGAITLALGLLLFAAAPNLWWLGVFMTLIPVGTALLFPASTSLLSHATEPLELGTMMGVAQTFAGIARIIAPLAGGMVFQRVGIDSPFILGGLIMIVVAVATARVTFPRPAPATSST